MNFKQIIVTILSKLRFLNSDEELDLEAVLLWVFLFIVAFRAFFANVTISYGADFKWVIPDSSIATTLPVLYSLLSNSHRRYLDSKTTTSDSAPKEG